MRTFVSPIGYDSTRITRPLLSHGLDSGDHVILLVPMTNDDEDPRSREAVDDVERILQQLEPAIDVTTEPVAYADLQETVFQCCDIIQAVEGGLVANFGGGPRDIYLGFCIAVLGHLDAIETVTQFSDIDGSVDEIQLPHLTAQISGTGYEVLNIVGDLGGETTIPELTQASERSKSTITRHISQLEDCQAVESEMHGKTKTVHLTFSGDLLLELPNAVSLN